ncbi:metallophosphoesterase [Oculatella sp. LEGE 06141]|nr:metallophosphoesterase [Oculatella sp. LEGE 06141]MBE9182476.1 metallophosphoesterase [Oculatella sp. LEGE 06141]
MNKHLWRRIKYLLLGAAGCLLVLLTWSVIEPYHLDRNVVVAEIPSLPQSWQGKQIAVVSDLQIGMWLSNTSTVEQAIAQIITDIPAVALIAGDFVYKPGEKITAELERVIELMRPLTAAQIPTYAVLGNHDYDAPTQAAGQQRATQIRQALESIGIQVLQNEAIALPHADSTAENESFYLVGIGAYLLRQSKPLVAIAQVPDNAARVVLMHNPASFAELPPGTAPVAIAGHTHGGQIRIPFLPQWSWAALKEDDPSWSWLSQIKGDIVRISGWIPGYGQAGNHLYINRGIGFSRLPIRFHCSPELTVFSLQAMT